jgi:hypothetical protein
MLSADAQVVLTAFLTHVEKIDVCLELHDIVQSVPATVKVMTSIKELEGAGAIKRIRNEQSTSAATQILWCIKDLALARLLAGGDYATPAALGPRLRPGALASSRLVAA